MRGVATGEEVLAPSPLQVHHQGPRALERISHPEKRATLTARQTLTVIRNRNRHPHIGILIPNPQQFFLQRFEVCHYKYQRIFRGEMEIYSEFACHKKSVGNYLDRTSNESASSTCALRVPNKTTTLFLYE